MEWLLNLITVHPKVGYTYLFFNQNKSPKPPNQDPIILWGRLPRLKSVTFYHSFWDISDWTKVVDGAEGIKKNKNNKTQNTGTAAEERYFENPEDSLSVTQLEAMATSPAKTYARGAKAAHLEWGALIKKTWIFKSQSARLIHNASARIKTHKNRAKKTPKNNGNTSNGFEAERWGSTKTSLKTFVHGGKKKSNCSVIFALRDAKKTAERYIFSL